MARMIRKTCRRGIVLIEVALILPLLLLVLLGLMEYGWMFLKSMQINNADRHGCRVACLPDVTNGDVTAQIDNLMALGGMGGSGYSIDFDPSDVSSPSPGDEVTVTLTVPYGNIGLNMPLVPVPASLQASVTMAKEGP